MRGGGQPVSEIEFLTTCRVGEGSIRLRELAKFSAKILSLASVFIYIILLE